MPTGFYRWSKAPNTNANVTYTWAEGMSPSSVNDSHRGNMSELAQWRDDIAGAIVTTGSATAYEVTSYQAFETLALMSGNLIAFTPHVTNTGTSTLNVDGLGAKPLRAAPSVELFAGTLIEGTPYLCLYNNSDAAWYLHGGVGNPNAYSIPLGASVTYWGSTAPSTNFALAQGQAISRTTYAALYALIGNTYGAGNGATTFNIPDVVGRVPVMLDAGSARISSTFFGSSPATLGNVGGSQSHTLTTAQLASHTHANTVSETPHAHTETQHSAVVNTSNFQDTAHFCAGPNGGSIQSALSTGSATAGVSISNASAGSGSAHNNMQPGIISNHIIRVL
jgi:microcystin-dependent protein